MPIVLGQMRGAESRQRMLELSAGLQKLARVQRYDRSLLAKRTFDGKAQQYRRRARRGCGIESMGAVP